MDLEHGYWIKVKAGSAPTLRLDGAAFPEDRNLALEPNLNLVSFLSRNRMGVG